MIAHTRNGKVIRSYPEGKGRLTLENGDTVSPIIVGYTNGADKVLPVRRIYIDNSTTEHRTSTTVHDITDTEVIERVTFTDIDIGAVRAGASLSRFDFAARSAAAGFITYDEAADWAAGNAIPEIVIGVIASLPEGMRGPTTLDVKASLLILRTSPLLEHLKVVFDTDDAALDQLFGI